MKTPILIIIQGSPATGKTTLARRLASDLRIFALDKDDVKEMLFDKFGRLTPEQDKTVGAAAFEAMYAIADTILAAGSSIILSAPFTASLATAKIKHIIRQNKPQIIQIYLTANEKVRQQRYDQRISSGARHPGHHDRIGHILNFKVHAKKYLPMPLKGKQFIIDTSSPTDQDYDKLLMSIKENQS